MNPPSGVATRGPAALVLLSWCCFLVLLSSAAIAILLSRTLCI